MDDLTKTMEDCKSNPATLENAVDSECGYCNNPIVFGMRDNFHQFSVGLLTILECLKIAEIEGHVPKLPVDWWIALANRYNFQNPE